MKHLSIAARVLTPLAMVTFLTIEITQSQNLPAPLIYVIAVAAFFTSVGLEAWGVMAGQNLERAWRMNRGKWSTALMLILYASVSVYLLRTNSTLIVLPIVAALVYVSAALSDSLETAVSKQDEQTAVQQAFDLEQEARENDHRRQMETQQAERAAANDLQIALAHEQALAAVEIAQAKTRASIANAEARMVLAQAKSEPAVKQLEPAPASYVCEDCGQPFATVQALNAHGRKHRKHVNGVAS